MSAASTAFVRSGPPPAGKYEIFWPMLIFFLGMTVFTAYQLMALEDALDEITTNIDQLDGKVKLTQHQKAKFFSLVKDLLHLAPTNANAQQIVTQYNLKALQASQRELMDFRTQAEKSSQTSGGLPSLSGTNTAPTTPIDSSNAAPLNPENPASGTPP